MTPIILANRGNHKCGEWLYKQWLRGDQIWLLSDDMLRDIPCKRPIMSSRWSLLMTAFSLVNWANTGFLLAGIANDLSAPPHTGWHWIPITRLNCFRLQRYDRQVTCVSEWSQDDVSWRSSDNECWLVNKVRRAEQRWIIGCPTTMTRSTNIRGAYLLGSSKMLFLDDRWRCIF